MAVDIPCNLPLQWGRSNLLNYLERFSRLDWMEDPVKEDLLDSLFFALSPEEQASANKLIEGNVLLSRICKRETEEKWDIKTRISWLKECARQIKLEKIFQK